MRLLPPSSTTTRLSSTDKTLNPVANLKLPTSRAPTLRRIRVVEMLITAESSLFLEKGLVRILVPMLYKVEINSRQLMVRIRLIAQGSIKFLNSNIHALNLIHTEAMELLQRTLLECFRIERLKEETEIINVSFNQLK